MKLPTFKTKLSAALKNTTLLGYSTAALATVVLLQQIKINDMHERLTVIPPHLTEQAVVGWNEASSEYYKKFGLYIVTTLSTAVPETVDYVASVLQPFFAKDVWNKLKGSLMAIKDDPNYKSINPVASFTPTGGILYEKETDTYFISGRLVSSAYKSGVLVPIGAIRATYEFKMTMNNGLPLITEFYSYEGEPHTLQWAANNRAKYDEEHERRELLKKEEKQGKQTTDKPVVTDDKVGVPNNSLPMPVNSAQDPLEQSRNAEQGIGLNNGISPKPQSVDGNAHAAAEEEARKAVETLELDKAQ